MAIKPSFWRRGSKYFQIMLQKLFILELFSKNLILRGKKYYKLLVIEKIFYCCLLHFKKLRTVKCDPINKVIQILNSKEVTEIEKMFVIRGLKAGYPRSLVSCQYIYFYVSFILVLKVSSDHLDIFLYVKCVDVNLQKCLQIF